jgi:hypothetical protein
MTTFKRLRIAVLALALGSPLAGLNMSHVGAAEMAAAATNETTTTMQDAVLRIYGPYATPEARNAAAGTSRSWTGDYVTSPPPGVPGVRVTGYNGPGYYFWYD